MIRLPRWPVWMMAALLMMAALACSVEFTTAHFEDAALFREASGETRTRSFGRHDTIYCITDLKDTDDKALPVKMEMVRIITHEDGTQEETIVTSDEQASRSDHLIFTLTPPESGFERGDYQVRLYLDGEKKEALDFKIK